jgi:hypothetical protein
MYQNQCGTHRKQPQLSLISLFLQLIVWKEIRSLETPLKINGLSKTNEQQKSRINKNKSLKDSLATCLIKQIMTIQ